jgi:Protein of unknown function (DUF2029).
VPWLLYVTTAQVAIDAHAYFQAQSGTLYDLAWGTGDAYVYSPAFSQIIEPLRWLGWDGFRTTWRLLELGALTMIAGPLVGPLLFVSPVALEINLGNIHLLMAGAIVAGFRYPALWSFVLLTKVTPGVGLLWFAVRREWRSLSIALGVTTAIAGVSFVLAPSDWFAWAGLLVNPPTLDLAPIVTAPLVLRLLFAAGLVTWGALRGYRWTVIIAAYLALPSVGLAAAGMLVGLLALRGRGPADAEQHL